MMGYLEEDTHAPPFLAPIPILYLNALMHLNPYPSD